MVATGPGGCSLAGPLHALPEVVNLAGAMPGPSTACVCWSDMKLLIKAPAPQANRRGTSNLGPERGDGATANHPNAEPAPTPQDVNGQPSTGPGTVLRTKDHE